MARRSGFTCYALMLLVGISSATGAVARERPFTISWENEPTEAICFPTRNGGPNAVCVTLFADEDGYEMCVADKMASRERCISNYPSADPDGSEDGSPQDQRWSEFDL